MGDQQQEEMTRLGFWGLSPFVLSAVALWLSPVILPQHIALDFHQLALAYGGIVVAYLAGSGAGVTLAPKIQNRGSALPAILISLAAFIAILPSGVFFMAIGAVWRHAIIFGLLIYLLVRDTNAVNAGQMPLWYGALRLRLTFWAGLSILLIISRLLLWGYY